MAFFGLQIAQIVNIILLCCLIFY